MSHRMTAGNGQVLALTVLALGLGPASALRPTAQQPPRPEDTEVWAPVPRVVVPGATNSDAPSDAIVLFDGKNLDEWVSVRDRGPAKWMVTDGIVTVTKAAGNIETKRRFKN